MTDAAEAALEKADALYKANVRERASIQELLVHNDREDRQNRKQGQKRRQQAPAPQCLREGRAMGAGVAALSVDVSTDL